MDRDKIKIVEFGDDGEPQGGKKSATNTRSSPPDDGIKIREFGNSREPEGQKIARPENMGPIKIVEFDNDSNQERAPRQEPQSEQRYRMPTQKDIKVVEFDDDGVEKNPAQTKSGGMKIVEFD